MKGENRIFNWCDNHPATTIFLVYLLAVLLGIFVVGPLLHCSVANAESAIVSFDDEYHLAALTDSVVGVCDTTEGYYYNLDCPEDTIWFDAKPGVYAWLPGCWNGVKSWTDSMRTSEWQYSPETITCRRLVCVEVTKPIVKIPNAEYWSVYTWDKPIPFIVDPPDFVRDAEYWRLFREWEEKLSAISPTDTTPGKAIIFYEEKK